MKATTYHCWWKCCRVYVDVLSETHLSQLLSWLYATDSDERTD